MTLKELVINEDDFDVFVALDPAEKIEFLWDAMCLGTEKSVHKQIAKMRTQHETVLMSWSDIEVGSHRLIVLNINKLIILSSDNLKVIRNFVRQMWGNGYIISRRRDVRKSKWNDDFLKYFVAYNVVGEFQPISDN